jgi:hypothetical protein
MGWSRLRACGLFLLVVAVAAPPLGAAQSSSASSSKHGKSTQTRNRFELDPGSVNGGIYRNRGLGLVCTIPAGWVLRTQELNTQDSETSSQGDTENNREGKVLLAAFARPPEAKGAEVNSSILIAAESLTVYPGVKEPEQYFEPLDEVAKAQGFVMDEEPYDFTIGTKALVRADFHKDVGSRVMHQSSLVMLTHGYAVSMTFIGGSSGEVEELIGGLDFSSGGSRSVKK